ncbi:farnesyl cysteine-carboxyl methyltransferase [Coemansia thaxteri]|uniref:Protein-S-isoprenylcysteine O-methyltransferase n=1 Tax=Coemansia thaxteri TaxID=2663907 RepID=A0A9W8EDD3_9FUNG|nr:farnesyl cysteine-carboxyl methyltransferase [Coemansia thaxteri]KAJ2477009.1 farnesyl cysteine-carboxyl methyltransferase [Coemansia sp. RSA 2320]
MSEEARAAAFTPQVGLFRRRPAGAERWWTPIVALDFDVHSGHNIALTACCLGMAIGVGICIAAANGWSSLGVFGVYTALLALYHIAEYMCVALFNPNRASMESFMFNPDQGNYYYKAMLVSVAEYYVECWLCCNAKAPGLLTLAGLVLALVGQATRSLAMITAKTSFNHYIANRRELDHQLITHGIYKYERHPSYVGFFCWAVGLQLMLKNPVSLIAFAGVLGHFFCSRTSYEERTLLHLFGTQYEHYRQQTPTLIPFVDKGMRTPKVPAAPTRSD